MVAEALEEVIKKVKMVAVAGVAQVGMPIKMVAFQHKLALEQLK